MMFKIAQKSLTLSSLNIQRIDVVSRKLTGKFIAKPIPRITGTA